MKSINKGTNKRVSRKELLSLISSKHKISRSKADEIVKMVINEISQVLSKGESLSLVGFGTFYTTKTKARTGRNPLTGKPLNIKSSNHVRFRAGSGLKKVVQS